MLVEAESYCSMFVPKATHYELLLEEIRQSSCAILQLEGQVSTLEKDGLVMKDLLASTKASIDNLQLKLNVSKKENEQLKKALQNRRETQQNNQAIAKLQDQVEKARKGRYKNHFCHFDYHGEESKIGLNLSLSSPFLMTSVDIVRLTSQRDSLAEAKDKERLSYQLKIQRKEGRIERLEAELDTKQKRLIDLEADVVWANSQHCDVTKDPQYDKVKRENCQMKDEILRLMAKLDSLEKDNDVKRTLTEQTLYGERYRHLAKVNSLENVCLQLEKANRELQTKISQLMDNNASTRSMTNQDKAQFQAEISRKLKQEVEEELKLESNKLLANTTKMESKLSQMQHANENLKSELSALRNMQRQAKGPSMEATLQELQEWKGRTENLNLKIAECKTAASEASNERETLRRQLDVANERNRVLEAASLPQQDGHNITVLESIDSTKSNNIQQHLEAMTKKMKESNECTKARLKEVANTSSDSGAVPFVSRGFSRPAFGLGKRSED